MSNCSYVVEQPALQLEHRLEFSSSETVLQQDSNTLPRQDELPYDDMTLSPASGHYKKPVTIRLTIE